MATISSTSSEASMWLAQTEEVVKYARTQGSRCSVVHYQLHYFWSISAPKSWPTTCPSESSGTCFLHLADSSLIKMRKKLSRRIWPLKQSIRMFRRSILMNGSTNVLGELANLVASRSTRYLFPVPGDQTSVLPNTICHLAGECCWLVILVCIHLESIIEKLTITGHRNPPHGGLGMNSGIEDALAVSWRLSAVLKGYGGPHLLPSYEAELRPVMITRLERCNYHVGEHIPRYQWFGASGPDTLMAKNEQGDQLRKQIKDQLQTSGSECLDRGIELDSRYKSAVIFQDGSKEPEWEFKKYVPSTFPGSRAPHVILKDGKTSIIDYYGPEFSLVAFIKDSKNLAKESFAEVAKEMGMDLKIVLLGEEEEHAQKIWGSNLVLLRADGHVAWRGQKAPERADAEEILKVVTGQKVFPGYRPAKSRIINIEGISVPSKSFIDEELLALGERV